ncbi:MAG: type I 3-dehydroquinate dehydratase [Methanotrichaceae archaeon]
MKPRIVAALGKDAARDISACGDADMIEVRLDLIDKPLETLKAVRSATEKPIIVTNRLKSEGGQFGGSEQERIRILSAASAYADWIDIELKAPMRDVLLKMIDKPAIISYHDFIGMPPREELEAILKEMKQTGAKIAKIAVTPSSLKDNLTILDFLLDARMPICMIAMGQIGRHLRAVAPLYGSVLTYGFVSQAVAPGQMSIAELRLSLKLLDTNFVCV